MDTCEIAKKVRGARSKQKQKMMYLAKILQENTDANHDITLQEIIDKLDANGVTSERKSLYDDLAQLENFGFQIEKKQYGKSFHYKIVKRDFELAELKLLVDSVQAAKFISEEKSNELIRKIEHLSSRHEASQLQRQVYVSGRVKTMNRDIMGNVDAIHNAIANNAKISFQYFQWNVKKEMELRRDGQRYLVSPLGLSWDDENYYLVGYDSETESIKHYRVDKMLKIKAESARREGFHKFKQEDMAVYAKKMFSMFDGEDKLVSLLCENQFAGIMIDRFGKDIHLMTTDQDHFKMTVKVATSNHFIHWIMALGDGVRITGPKEVEDQVRCEIARLAHFYNNVE